jgi:hypothetical protein
MGPRLRGDDRTSGALGLLPLPPNSGLPEFGTLSRPKSDESDFGWERGGVRGYGLSMGFEPPHPNPLPKGEREQSQFAAC